MTINSDSCYKGKPLKRPETCLFWYTKRHVKLYDYQFSPMYGAKFVGSEATITIYGLWGQDRGH